MQIKADAARTEGMVEVSNRNDHLPSHGAFMDNYCRLIMCVG